MAKDDLDKPHVFIIAALAACYLMAAVAALIDACHGNPAAWTGVVGGSVGAVGFGVLAWVFRRG